MLQELSLDFNFNLINLCLYMDKFLKILYRTSLNKKPCKVVIKRDKIFHFKAFFV